MTNKTFFVLPGIKWNNKTKILPTFSSTLSVPRPHFRFSSASATGHSPSLSSNTFVTPRAKLTPVKDSPNAALVSATGDYFKSTPDNYRDVRRTCRVREMSSTTVRGSFLYLTGVSVRNETGWKTMQYIPKSPLSRERNDCVRRSWRITHIETG